jgi:hypothetical protein
MRIIIASVSVVAVLLGASDALAGRCAGATGDLNALIMCEDFDRYCDTPPTDSQGACDCRTQDPDTTNPPDANSLYANWPPEGSCSGMGGATALDDLVYWRPDDPASVESWKCHHDAGANQGYMARIYQHDETLGVSVYRNARDITSLIQGSPRNTGHYNYINGVGDISTPLNSDNTVPSGYIDSLSSTLRPGALKGRFMMYFAGVGAFSNMIYYTELYLDDDRAPFNFQTTYCAPFDQWSSGFNNPRLVVTDNQVHASFALGMVATTDGNPCDLDTGRKPTDWQLAVYDGRTWQTFKVPAFGIPSVTPEHGADLAPKDGWNTVWFSIGADNIEVRLSNSWSDQNHAPNGSNNPNSYCVARVPRQYKGPFNKVAIGPSKGVDLVVPTCENFGTTALPALKCNGGANDQGVCTTAADCPAATTPICPRTHAGADMFVDELALWDGTFQDKPAACCKPDLTCVIADPVTCASLSGTFHSGAACDPSPCCPIPWADSDRDGNVDMNDFAALQRCITIGAPGGGYGVGCACFDTNKDGAINATDIEKFALCAQGEGVTVTSCP